jgi:hypothetical protein
MSKAAISRRPRQNTCAWRAPGPFLSLTCVPATRRIGRRSMRKQLALAVLLSLPTFAQTHAPVKSRLERFAEVGRKECQVPEGFRCGILVNVDLPDSGGMIASVVGGVVRQISLILGGTMYTVVYDPPLKRDDKFSSLRRYVRVPARIDGDDLTVQWPDKTEAKGRIVQREKVPPELPQPA